MTAIERIRTALSNYAPVSTDILAAFNFRQACDPIAMAEVLAHIDALTAENERLRKDAERYQWLAEYLVSDDESYDDQIVSSQTVEEISYVIDTAMKGEKP